MAMPYTSQSADVPPTKTCGSDNGQEIGDEGHEEKEDESPAARPSAAIGMNFCDHTPLLWRAADVRSARESGIVGTLIGSLPRQPRQNCRLGRPLQLMQEERRLLGEMGKTAAAPAKHKTEGGEVHPELMELYTAEQERSFQEQSILALEDRKTALVKVMTGRQKGKGTSNKTIEDHLEALEKGFTFPRSAMAVQLCTAMAVQLCTAKAGLTYGAEERDFLSSTEPAGSQGNQRSETRFRVFRDLKKQGFYLTSAGKFGGDYLVYPGDPLRFHAHFIAVCLPMDEPMSLCDILAIARLGSNVKKTVLLCSSGSVQDEESEEVVYTSLQWSGMV